MQPKMVGKKSQFKNYSEDGIKIRAEKFRNKVRYSRKDRSWMKEEEWKN